MKDKLTCYIIDDEPLAQEILEEYISKVPFLELKGSFFSPLEAASSLEKDQPDLLFLDINMPDIDGLSYMQMLNRKPMIILTTAYDQYALKAFELDVKDYLLKPFSFERFYKGVLRLYQEQSSKPLQEKKDPKPELKSEQEYIFLKVGQRLQKVAIRDILFVEGMKDYLRIHTTDEKIMTLLNFARLEELLDQVKNLWGRYVYAYISVSLYKKNGIFFTPLNWLLNAFIFALKDSAEALVLLFSKKLTIVL